MTVAEQSRRYAVLRRATAWIGHAPGLWLVYREPLQQDLRAANVVAVVVTLIGIALAAAFGGWAAGLLAWIIGHVAWGTYLAWKLAPLSYRARRPGADT